MEELQQTENNQETLSLKSEKIISPKEILPTVESVTKELDTTKQKIQQHEGVISDTTSAVNKIREDFGLSGAETNIPSIDFNKKAINQLENKKVLLEKKLQEILQSDVSEKYKDIIVEVKQSKIDWAHSNELARRLKLKGATEEDVLQVKNWLIDNTTNAKTFVLPPHKFKEVIDVLHEMTGEENIKEGQAFHVPGGRTDIPDHIKSSVFVKENPAKPPVPGQVDKPKETVNVQDLHHEMGHVAQDGLLESELYQDWDPKFKEGAPDKKYVGLINETDTRVRSMYRDLNGVFDPKNEEFSKKHIELLRAKLVKGELNKDTKDLFDHYDDETIIKLANQLPAI